MELLNQKRKSREIHPVLFFSAVLCLFYGNLYTGLGTINRAPIGR